MKSISWKTHKVKISDLKEHPKNPRQLSEKSAKELQKSFKKFGYVEIVAINLDNTILAGHQRVKTMIELGDGDSEIEVRIPSRMLTDKEAEEYLVRSNKNVGEWDFDILANQFEESDLFDWGFDSGDLVGLTEDEIEEIESEEGEVDVTPPENPFSQSGDIYEFGDHRLLCGDSSQLEAYEKLLGDEVVDLIVTDPPYNVDYSAKSNSINKTRGGKGKVHKDILNDKMSNDNFYQFLYDVFTNMYLKVKEGGPIYVFFADSEGINFRVSFVNAGFKLAQCLIWVKNCLVMGRSDYQFKHEPILYGWKEGSAHCWYSDRKQTTILEFNKPHRNVDHPTMKPLDIISYLIGNSSQTGEIVLDAFGGSGSTIMACEQTKRKGRSIELSPAYCDVIVKRWVKYRREHGKDDSVIRNGEKFDLDGI
jgi:DNA modification methylase